MARTYTRDLIQKQVAAEEKMQESGAASFIKAQDANAESGKASENASSIAIIKKYITPISESIVEFSQKSLRGKAGVNATSINLLSLITTPKGAFDADRIALTAISTVFDTVTARDTTSRQTLYTAIGKALEDEAKFDYARNLGDGKWLDWKMKQFKEEHHSYHNMKTSLNFSMNKFAERNSIEPFQKWSVSDKVSVGMVIYHLITTAAPIVEEYTVTVNNKSVVSVCFTPETMQFMDAFKKAVAKGFVKYRPMTIEPVAWTGFNKGGYLTIELPFVKDSTYVDNSQVDFSTMMKAVNNIQNTPWKINKRMFNLINELSLSNRDVTNSNGSILWFSSASAATVVRPEILDNQEMVNTEEFKVALREYKEARVTQIKEDLKRNSVWNNQHEALAIANEFLDEQYIYFPHNLDFRGRVYPIPGILNPQGSDPIRSLLTFAEGKILTDDGSWWLCVAIAGLYGYDKVSLNDRAEWTMNNYETLIKPVAVDPMGTIELWGLADSPFQFVAACMEYHGFVQAVSKGEDYVCNLPIQVDGKCNGVQHHSMMTRDQDAAAEVGLIPTAVPGDIYKKVAKAAFEFIKQDIKAGTFKDDDEELAAKAWFAMGEIPRGIAKKPTMTFCYGSGTYGYIRQIQESLYGMPVSKRPQGDIFKLSAYLAKVITKALAGSIEGAAQSMQFLKSTANLWAKSQVMANTHMPLTWVTPAGFTVSQKYCESECQEYKARLGTSRIKVRIYADTDKLDVSKMASSMAPNFVHSIDASHLVLTVIKCAERYGMAAFSVIHDSFGCHPSDMDRMVECIKEVIVEIHSTLLLQDLADEVSSKLPSELTELMIQAPVVGTLDIQKVLESDFVFA